MQEGNIEACVPLSVVAGSSVYNTKDIQSVSLQGKGGVVWLGEEWSHNNLT